MKNKIYYDDIFVPLSVAIVLWAFASCESKQYEQRKKTERLKLMLEHGQDIKREDYE